MDKLLIKSSLIECCRKRLLETVHNLEAAMQDAQVQANEYGAPRDRYDAFRTQLMRKKDMLAQQLNKELIELQTLDRIDARKIASKAEFGSIVLSDQFNYFIAIGLGKIQWEGITFYAVSPQVPISLALAGKKAGEVVHFRDQSILIRDII